MSLSGEAVENRTPRPALLALCLAIAAMPLETAGWLGGSALTLSKLMLAACVGLLAAEGLLARRRFEMPPGAIAILLFWLLTLAVSGAKWMTSSLDFPNNLIAITGYVLLVFLAYWIVRTDAAVDAVTLAVIAGSLPVVGVGLAEYVLKRPMIANQAEHLYASGADELFRLTATFYDANALGRYLVFASLLTLAATSRPRFRRWRVPMLALLAVQLFCLVNSFSRGSVLAVVGAFCVYLLWRRRLREPVGAAVLVATAGLVAVFALVPAVPRALEARLFDSATGQVAAGTRPAIAHAAVLAIERSPLVGYGPDHDTEAIGRFYGSMVSAHNLYLETLLIVGVPGALLLVWYAFRQIRRLLASRERRTAVRNRVVLLPLLGLLIGGLTLHGFKESELWVLVALFAPLVRLQLRDEDASG